MRVVNRERLVLGLPLLVYVVVYFVDGTGFHPNGDGFYSWIYARSLAFGADLDFRDDYAICGDPFHAGVDRGTGRPDNVGSVRVPVGTESSVVELAIPPGAFGSGVQDWVFATDGDAVIERVEIGDRTPRTPHG